MKNGRHFITVFILCLAMMLSFAACSNTSNDPAPPANTDPDNGTTEILDDDADDADISDDSTDTAIDDSDDSSDGKSGNSSTDSGQTNKTPDGLISEEEAIQIVLSRVKGATKDNLTAFETDYDDGRWQYEGELVYDGLEYEFEIDAQNGNILDWEIED